MNDKEVGKLWRLAHKDELTIPQYNLSIYVDYAISLIHKLVEERAKAYKLRSGQGHVTKDTYYRAACHDFGIDFDEWSKGTS